MHADRSDLLVNLLILISSENTKCTYWYTFQIISHKFTSVFSFKITVKKFYTQEPEFVTARAYVYKGNC